MSQSRSADAARRVALRAERGAGSALAPRNGRLTGRLIVLVAIPMVLGLALTGLRVTDATRSAQAYGRVAFFGHAEGRRGDGLSTSGPARPRSWRTAGRPRASWRCTGSM